MSPYCANEEDTEKILQEAAQELSKLLTEYIGGIQWECIKNPDRRFWQFWKPKYIFIEVEKRNGSKANE